MIETKQIANEETWIITNRNHTTALTDTLRYALTALVNDLEDIVSRHSVFVYF